MDIVYYWSPHMSIPPVVKFLIDKYGSSLNYSTKAFNNLTRIRKVIEYARDKRGMPDGNLLDVYRGYKFNKLRINITNGKIRIPYFVYTLDNCNRLVLLNAFEKPKAPYNRGGSISRFEIRILNITNKYYLDYLSNPNHFLEYQYV
jgi:hypothetical protein